MARRYGISAPVRNVESLQRVGAQLKDAVEGVLGYRGNLYADLDLPLGQRSDFDGLLAYLEALEGRVSLLEERVSFLFDGTYAHGIASGVPFLWAPGVTTPTDATRLPVDLIEQLSNISHPNDYGFVPVYPADYTVSIDLRFEPDQNNADWVVAPFRNGVQLGGGVAFNSRDESILTISASIGTFLDAGDTFDVRLWPLSAVSTGDILLYSFDMEGRGVDESAVGG